MLLYYNPKDNSNTALAHAQYAADTLNWAQAKAHARQALAADKNCAPAYVILAQAELNTDRYTAALDAFRAAEKLGYTTHRSVLGMACAAAGLAQYGTALTCLTRLERMTAPPPSDTVRTAMHYQLGLVYEGLAQPKQAIEAYQKCVNAEGENPYFISCLTKLINLHEQAGQYDEAITCADNLILLDKKSWPYRQLKARLLLAQDTPASRYAARILLTDAFALCKTTADACERLLLQAALEAAEQKNKAALDCVQKAAQLPALDAEHHRQALLVQAQLLSEEGDAEAALTLTRKLFEAAARPQDQAEAALLICQLLEEQGRVEEAAPYLPALANAKGTLYCSHAAYLDAVLAARHNSPDAPEKMTFALAAFDHALMQHDPTGLAYKFSLLCEVGRFDEAEKLLPLIPDPATAARWKTALEAQKTSQTPTHGKAEKE